MQKFLFFASGDYFAHFNPKHRKIFLSTMKVNLIGGLLLSSSLQLMALPETLGQRMNTVKIHMESSSMSLKKALQELENKSGITIFYPSDLVEQYMAPTLDRQSRSVAQTLQLMLRQTNLSFKETSLGVVLFEDHDKQRKVKNEREQPRRIGGIVLDDQGKPIAGVTVLTKNGKELGGLSGNSTATDQNGHWGLPVTGPVSTLVFSMIGYETQELALSGRSEFKIVLKTLENRIEDVVVTGLFERPKEMYTGAARSFTKEQLQNVSSDNVLSAIKSLDPSFQMPENLNLGSNPNALPEVTLRGGNSLIDPNSSGSNPFNYSNNPNTPLFILDGFEVSLSRINDLDLTRIKNIDLLKDATATSIYGSRAANGVVVIETIRPKSGKLQVTYTGNMTLEMPDLKGYDVLNAAEKLELERQIGVYDYSWNGTDQQLKTIYNNRLAAVRSGVNTD